MVRKSKKLPDELPQKNETWHVYIWKMRLWITPPDEEPQRPLGLLVLNLDKQMIQGIQLLEDEPVAEEIFDQLVDVIRNPNKQINRRAYRPARIQFEDEKLAAELIEPLRALGIQAIPASHLEIVDAIVGDLEINMRGVPDPPGLLSVERVTPELVGGLFAAAAELYRSEPWLGISDEHTFAITVPPEKEPRFLKIMGYAGIEYGVATYLRWEDVERFYQFADDPFEAIPEDGMHSFFFHDITTTPIADLEAIEEYGWEVADEEAYPVPLIFFPDEEEGVHRPTRAGQVWYEAAFLALLVFIEKHLKEKRMDEFHEAEADIPVKTHAGEVTVHIKYPGGTISKELRPVSTMHFPAFDEDGLEDDLPFLDRRVTEGAMRMFREGYKDPKLNEAQDLMYDAWEETNPARRINLAHQALTISQDCADAYVLLAEEEADTVSRALELYKQGKEAGERALGKKFFKENEGYFWGILKTRPYMRAREGYARLLWQIGRREEAASHYRDMLHLNPGDNQGIRYNLASLLLELDHDEEVIALLDEYADDGMADFRYTRALVEFRRAGASPKANTALEEAIEMNQYVPAYLTGRKPIPNRQPDYITWGGESEAANYAGQHLKHWRHTRGALDWLKAQTGVEEKPKRKKRVKRGRRRSSRPDWL